MSTEARELYNYTTGTSHYNYNWQKDFMDVWNCVIDASRQYIHDYCSKGDQIFSDEDIIDVTYKIYKEV